MKFLGTRRCSCCSASAVASGAFLVSLILRAAAAYSVRMVAARRATSLAINVRRPLPSSTRRLKATSSVGSGPSKKAAQARAVFGGGDFGLVKNLDGHSVAAVDECRKADQRLPGLFDLHQLGQLAKRPGGVALACGGRWGDARRFRGGGRCPLYS